MESRRDRAASGRRGQNMSNRTTFGLAFLIAALFALAFLIVDQPHVFLGRKFLDLLQWIAFWR